jgi:hypothetical protein
MTGLTAEHCLPAWQVLQMTEITAENRFTVWQTLQMTEVPAEKSFVQFVRQIRSFLQVLRSFV